MTLPYRRSHSENCLVGSPATNRGPTHLASLTRSTYVLYLSTFEVGVLRLSSGSARRRSWAKTPRAQIITPRTESTSTQRVMDMP